ncbi:MAG TPA: hypothetical protein VKE74_24255 [Gemmataceae bacterium]|nr:hypothetical protein [Gemmataceae bacterium]
MIFWSIVIAAALVTTVATVVGTLTYLLTREPAEPAPTGPKPVPVGLPAARERDAAEVPTAVAG